MVAGNATLADSEANQVFIQAVDDTLVVIYAGG
jgi:hypothetical protein